MAPRGRPRKGLTRLDAAIDAMRNLGFEDEVVRRTVKELLSIYGGDGWPFIEEYGYKELIDAILRGPEAPEEEILDKKDSTASGQICSEVGDFAPEADNAILKSPSSSICTNAQTIDNRGETPLANEDNNGGKEIMEYQSNMITSPQKERSNDICSSSGNPVAEINSQTPVVLFPTDSPQLVNPPQQPRRRLPCYGWIDSDDEEVVDFIYSRPVDPTKRPTQFSSIKHGTDNVKRSSRWDLEPGNN